MHQPRINWFIEKHDTRGIFNCFKTFMKWSSLWSRFQPIKVQLGSTETSLESVFKPLIVPTAHKACKPQGKLFFQWLHLPAAVLSHSRFQENKVGFVSFWSDLIYFYFVGFCWRNMSTFHLISLTLVIWRVVHRKGEGKISLT